MWNICTNPTNPTILLAIGEEIPLGYTVEAQTSNPNYLTESATTPGNYWITKLAFRNRFTMAEKVTIEIASIDDPIASMAVRQQAAGLRVYLKDLDNATYIDLARPDTQSGVQQLEALGIIGAGRAVGILSTLIADSERPSTSLLPPGHYDY